MSNSIFKISKRHAFIYSMRPILLGYLEEMSAADEIEKNEISESDGKL